MSDELDELEKQLVDGDIDKVINHLSTKAKELTAFLDELGPLDKMNFQMIVNLPNPERMLREMPDCKYKNMLEFAIGLKLALPDLEKDEELTDDGD
jgi:hypothetical protein